MRQLLLKTLLVCILLATSMTKPIKRIPRPLIEDRPIEEDPVDETNDGSDGTDYSGSSNRKNIWNNVRAPAPSTQKLNFKIANYNSVPTGSQYRLDGGATGKINSNSDNKPSMWSYITQQSIRAKESQPKSKPPQPTQRIGASTQNKDEVRSEVLSWWTKPIGEGIQDKMEQIQHQHANNSTHNCFLKTYQYTKGSYITMNIDQPYEALFPGGFIQGKSIKTGAQPLERLMIAPNERLPFDINSPAGLLAQEVNPTAVDVNYEIVQNLTNQMNDVWIGFATTKTLPSVFDALNFNSRVADKLGISKSSQSMIYVIMQQIINEYFPSMIPLDRSFISDPIGVFLKNSFDAMKMQAFKNYLFWGPDNIPTYVNRVFYGRFLAVSVEENDKNRQIYRKINTGALQSDEIQRLLNSMFQDPKMVFSRGPFNQIEQKQIKSGKWSSFFGGEMDKDKFVDIRKMAPIAFSLSDFRDQPVKFSNSFKYKILQCQAKPVIVPVPVENKVFVQLSEVIHQANLEINTGGGFWALLPVGPDSHSPLQITQHLSKDKTDAIRVNNAIRKNCWLCVSWRRARIRVWFDVIDDAHLAANVQSSCENCHSDQNAIFCRINKSTKNIQCQTH